MLLVGILILLSISILVSSSYKEGTITTTTISRITTTIIDCTTMNPNYCNSDDDCICSMSKCFKGNKLYAEHCVEEAEVCSKHFCFFAPGEGMICRDHTCQVEKKCTPEGEPSMPPYNCCPSLDLVADCLPGESCPISLRYCVDCGDQECDAHENWYNCPEDCE